MKDYYYQLDHIIKDEIDDGQEIAIYPVGKLGLMANEIITVRYGRKAYKIDNYLAKYNADIYSLEDYMKIDSKQISIIVCLMSEEKSKEFKEELIRKSIKAKIIDVNENFIINIPEKENYFKEIKSLCKVKRCLGYELVRVGKDNDGGYIMPDDFASGGIAYSFGIGGDISWEKQMADQGFKVYCFDHTIDRLPENYENCFFVKKGITGCDSIEDNLYSIETLLLQNGHENEKNMVLKMDVEGAEWDFLCNVSTETLDMFSLMTFELHGLTQIENQILIKSVLRKINQTHQAVWIHANNAGPVERAGEYYVPLFLEITYANKKVYQFEDMVYNSPINIDSPNRKQYKDVELRNW